MIRISLIVGAVLAANMAHARMPADPVMPTGGASSSHSAAVADATQLQGQQQGQAQGQQQFSTSTAAGGDALASAQGGSGGAGGSGHGGAGGNAQQGQSIAVTGARQVGMLYLPTMIPPSCGAAITAGHGNTRNVTAGGISWTTERCWSVLIAADYERMGAYREACELRRDVVRKQARRARINIDCESIASDMRAAIAAAAAAAAIVPPSEPAPDYATREELRRAFEAASGKVVK